ncbi:MAG TPA: hypothetical protein VGL38_00455 [bacterium]|jgi:hypothetical protein
MPAKEHVIRVFVASPSDVAPERECLEAVIRELNISWSKFLGLRLELLRWETDVRPGFGDYPQDVINSQIGDDYDIFIGIMWSRFGIPTGQFGSGTEEEFSRAYKRFKGDASSVRLLMYFKSADIPRDQIDPSQIRKVNAFRASVSKKGGLYYSYNDLDWFAQYVRIHLSKEIQHWRSAVTAATAGCIASAPASAKQARQALQRQVNRDKDLNAEIARLINEGDPNFSLATQAGTKVHDARLKMFGAAKRLADGLKRMRNKFDKDPVRLRKTALVKFDRFCSEVNKAIEIQNVEMPAFRRAMSKAIESTAQIVLLSVDDQSEEMTKVLAAFGHDVAGYITQLAEREAESHSLEGMYGSMDFLRQLRPVTFNSLVDHFSRMRLEYAAMQCINRDLLEAIQTALVNRQGKSSIALTKETVKKPRRISK